MSNNNLNQDFERQSFQDNFKYNQQTNNYPTIKDNYPQQINKLDESGNSLSSFTPSERTKNFMREVISIDKLSESQNNFNPSTTQERKN